MTSFLRTLMTFYNTSTATNFPDVMLKKYKGNEALMIALFFPYLFIMLFIVMSVMVSIFYSNYKNYFSKIISNLRNQNDLVRIIEGSTSNTGIFNIFKLHYLLDLFHGNEECKRKYR